VGTAAPGESPGGSLRGIGRALLALAGTRFELAGVELREELLRAQRLLVTGVVAALLIGAALVLLGIFVAALFWDSHPLLGLGLVTVAYAALGAWLLSRLRSEVARAPLPFAATAREFQADAAALKGDHE
jgi:uncharacterized membrane protein YqjE